MDTFALKIFCLFLVSVFRITEVSSKNNRIKIIVPHKISIIHHHHHSRTADLKPKKKFHFDVRDMLKSNQIHEEEESEEDASEEGHFGRYQGETDEEASRRGVAYYAFPTSARPDPVGVYTRPVFLLKDSYDGRRPLPYEYHNHEDYDHPEESYQEHKYLVRGFRFK